MLEYFYAYCCDVLDGFGINPWHHIKAFCGKRGTQWPRVRKLHLALYPTCSACGGTEDLEVHHVEPFQNAPNKEYYPANLITLCEAPTRLCHFADGHLYSWRSWNKDVREWAARKLNAIQNRP